MNLKSLVMCAIACVAIITAAATAEAADGFEPLGPEEASRAIIPIPFYDGLLPDYALFFPTYVVDTGPVTYKVVEGDNLYRIALNHNIPLEVLINTNNLTSEVIHPGEELIIDSDDNNANASRQIVTSKPNSVAVSVTPSDSEQTAKTKSAAVSSAASEPAGEGKELVVTATAYTAYCTGCSGTTAYGIDLRSNPDQKVIAVDPKLIPLGTKVWVEGYGEAIAGDTGGAIKGHKIDVFIPSYENAMEWGVKKVKIKVLN
ncbi:LysM peptidoglycan-binding and 3D domain-containing protein [Sporosarcina sp. Te-1]|uniref:3D domain-containing protein n=1 Tax=Sporosarcina sp. Te-1 TaxID=2818390 RepID=UPI001A9EA071|nr:LysM peptidoglycan-binding and 3D domain-containing protein [Sporosarcina sp. Te-1]QTD42921.1 LysM peptidoglycan-binding domain-containing protein [Sporosarcina sp. Te-1]